MHAGHLSTLSDPTTLILDLLLSGPRKTVFRWSKNPKQIAASRLSPKE